MKSHQGLWENVHALAKQWNVKAIAQGASERNITQLSTPPIQTGVNILHEALFEKHIKQINLFITGLEM